MDVTREEVQRIFDDADKDGTGLLTEQEFVNSSKPGEVAGVRIGDGKKKKKNSPSSYCPKKKTPQPFFGTTKGGREGEEKGPFFLRGQFLLS